MVMLMLNQVKSDGMQGPGGVRSSGPESGRAPAVPVLGDEAPGPTLPGSRPPLACSVCSELPRITRGPWAPRENRWARGAMLSNPSDC